MVADPELAVFRYRFQGRAYSAATGPVNFRARWYAPGTGRCLSKDPIRILGGLNQYEFCNIGSWSLEFWSCCWRTYWSCLYRLTYRAWDDHDE